MFLHEVSRRAAAEIGLSVTDSDYIDAVTATFGNDCAYCRRPLEMDRAAVEHLEGMNRFRVGLHIPGNVVVACNRCNREKRRDDSLPQLVLANSGWECFLSHDSSRCPDVCKSCAYWRALLPTLEDRVAKMQLGRERIAAFCAGFPKSVEWGERARRFLRYKMDAIYREGQEFAMVRIKRAVEELFDERQKI